MHLLVASFNLVKPHGTVVDPLAQAEETEDPDSMSDTISRLLVSDMESGSSVSSSKQAND